MVFGSWTYLEVSPDSHQVVIDGGAALAVVDGIGRVGVDERPVPYRLGFGLADQRLVDLRWRKPIGKNQYPGGKTCAAAK